MCKDCYGKGKVHHFEKGVATVGPCPNPKCNAKKVDLKELRRKWERELSRMPS